MSKIEKQLEEGKEQLRSVVAPKELEGRLRNALDNTPSRKKKIPAWLVAAALVVLTFFVGYNYHAVAFYGKKLIGFDEIMTGTLRDLNEQGMGQTVDQTIELAEGSRLHIDGIMADENQLILYYTLENPDGLDIENLPQLLQLSGFLTDSHAVSGTATLNDHQTEVKGMQTFESVSVFAKKLTLHLNANLAYGKQVERKVTFPYDPNKAFQTGLKQSIQQTFKVDKGKVKFQSITATPTMTTITGKLNVENFDRIPLSLGGIELIANGKPLEQIGSGSTSSLGGDKFELHYDALPDQLESLQLVMNDFVGYKVLDKELSLADMEEVPVKIGEKDLYIRQMEQEKEQVKITIATENDVMLDGVSVKSGKEMTPLETTVNQTESQQENGEVLKERTLVFQTQKRPEHLIIEGMHYRKEYKKSLDIPVQ